MAAATVTVTGKAGAGESLTAQVINNVNSIFFNVNTQMFQIGYGNETSEAPQSFIDISGATAIAFTVSSHFITAVSIT